MEVQYRKQEFIFTTALLVAGILNFLCHYWMLSPEDIKYIYEAVYKRERLPFNYWANIFFPQISQVIIPYAVFLFIVHQFSKAVHLFFQKSDSKMHLTIIGKHLLIGAFMAWVLAIGMNAGTYFGHPHLFNYGMAGFHVLAWFGYNDAPLTNIFTGYFPALAITTVMILYTVISTLLIRYLNRTIRWQQSIIGINLSTGLLFFGLWICLTAFVFQELPNHIYYFAFLTWTWGFIGLFMVQVYFRLPQSPERNGLFWRTMLSISISVLFIIPFTAYLLIHQIPFFMRSFFGKYNPS